MLYKKLKIKIQMWYFYRVGIHENYKFYRMMCDLWTLVQAICDEKNYINKCLILYSYVVMAAWNWE
jgi:hypothetical protein